MMRLEKGTGWTVAHDMRLTVTHADVGGTVHTTIKIGGIVVASYLPGTKHHDLAQQIAEQVIAAAVIPLFASAVADVDATVVHPDYATLSHSDGSVGDGWSGE